MAMKRFPAFLPTVLFHPLEEILLEDFGSRVLPDLLETMKIVLVMSTLFSKD